MEDKKNFTFVMSGEQREAITILSEIEDRSLSKIAEYLMWAGLESYLSEKRLLSPFEVKQLSQSFKQKLEEVGFVSESASKAPVFDIDVADEKTASKKKKA